jgi:hypothetical protein
VAYLRTCWRRCPARSPGLRTATVVCFLCTSIAATRWYAISTTPPSVAGARASPAEPEEDQRNSDTRSQRQPGVPTGTGSSVILTTGLAVPGAVDDSGRPTQFHPPVGAAAAASCSYKRGIRRFVTRLAYALKIYMPTG